MAEHPLTSLLREQGLDPVHVPDANAVHVTVSPDGGPVQVYVFDEADEDYFMVLTPLAKFPLEQASADELRKLLELSSRASMAKISVVSSNGQEASILLATTECAKDGVTATKLRRRIEGCAALAASFRSSMPKYWDTWRKDI